MNYDPTISEVAVRLGLSRETILLHARAPFLGHPMLRDGRVLRSMAVPLIRRLQGSGALA